MKITVNKLELLNEMQKCLLAIENKATIPILSNVLFTAQGSRLWITGTDLDISLVHGLSANVLREGSAAIPAKKLLDCLKNLKSVEEKEITITLLENHWVTLACGPLLVKLVGMASTNFPALAPLPEAAPVVVPTAVLVGLIARSEYAISQEESRYTLNGALLVIAADHIRMVTTDGHRLAIVQHPGQFNVSGEARTLVPRSALMLLRKLLNGSPVVEISKDDSIIYLRSANWTMRSRILTGQFPTYEAVIPKFNNNEAVVMGKDLKASLTRVVQFADERSQAVRFKFNESGLTVSASSTESGEASECVKSSYTGKPFTMGLNAGFVLDVLGTLNKEDAVVIKTRDEQSAALLVPFPENGFNSQNIVMPMRM